MHGMIYYYHSLVTGNLPDLRTRFLCLLAAKCYMTSSLVSWFLERYNPQGWSKEALGLLRHCELHSHIFSNSKARFGRNKSQVTGQDLFFICIFTSVLLLSLTTEFWPSRDIVLAETNSSESYSMARAWGSSKMIVAWAWHGSCLTHQSQLSSTVTWTEGDFYVWYPPRKTTNETQLKSVVWHFQSNL